MSISVKSIRVSIDGVRSSGFDILIDDVQYRMEDFTLIQSLLAPNSLSFSIHKEPDEDIREAQFFSCGQIIGKDIEVELDTEIIESLSWNSKKDCTAEVSFKGVIISAKGVRNRSEYTIYVEAMGREALLNDNPSCKSFEKKTLSEIVNDVIDDYSSEFDACVDPRFTEPIPYCVQYNETNYDFLKRLAKRYGEWMYNEGSKWVFGKLKEGESVRLKYPSQDIPSYQVDLRIMPVSFSHVASSYNKYDSDRKEGLEEMQKPYNDLGDKVFEASQNRYLKQTMQNLHSGGYSDDDSRQKVLAISTKTQARGEKASMLT